MPIRALSDVLYESNSEIYPDGGSFVCRLDGDTFAVLVNEESFTEGLPIKMAVFIEERLSKVKLDLGNGTEKFLSLSEQDKELLKKHLSQPRVTISNPRLAVGLIDDTIKIINEDIALKKEEKRSIEIQNLVRRLG